MVKKYQENYSKLHGGRTLIQDRRFRKAEQILTIIQDYCHSNNIFDTKNWKVLDIGCSSGMVDFFLADNFNSILGIDIDPAAIELAKSNYHSKNIDYRLGNIDNISITEKFDLIICNSVLEHVPDQDILLKNIKSLLKPSGICFLSVPNKYTVSREPHYDLYFLSWFPRKMSNYYIRLLRKGSFYYETPPSYFRLKKLCKNFKIIDYTIERIRFPKKYHVEFRLDENSFITRLPTPLLSALKLFSPSFVLILENIDGE